MKAAMALFLALALVACEPTSMMDRPGATLDDASDEVQDSIEDARDDVEENIEEVID